MFLHHMRFRIPALLATIFLSSITYIAEAADSPATMFNSLYSFCTQTNCPNGSLPSGWLVQGYDGNFYGATATGGAHNDGTVFKIAPSGAITTLHSFSNSTDGGGPSALILATDGNFYGTTSQGGSNCSQGLGLCGTVFKITPTGILTTLYTFCSRPNCSDGFFPGAALVQGSDGSLYGTTSDGGTAGQCSPNGCGTVFKITLSGTLTTLYSFCQQGACQFVAPDGQHPLAALVQGADGSFYGTTSQGGSSDGCTFGCGTVFKVATTGVLTSLHMLVNSDDGSTPGEIMQALDGNFYGVTAGTLFKVTPGGTFNTIHTFTLSDGENPVGLMQATDGNFYGITSQGGSGSCIGGGCGTIFRTNASGAVTTLHSFTGTDGAMPTGGLVQGTDGNFYGTTNRGGSSTSCEGGCGTFFKLGLGLSPFVEALPAFGNIGGPVAILGTNLTTASAVSFNGTAASFQVVSQSEITTTVPTGATTGKIRVTVVGSTLITPGDFQVVAPLALVPVTPCRLIDTRQTHNPIPGGTSQSFTLSQLGGCGIPANAAAYSLNVTVAPHGPLGYLIVWPTGEVQPYVSTMNSPDGRIKANAAIVAGGNDAISVYASDTTDLVLDINAYFISTNSQSYQFYPLKPCRIIDTRNGQDGGSLQAGVERDYSITGNCAVPSNAVAYSFNVTAVPTYGSLDYLTVWPAGETQPKISTLNNITGTYVANAAIVVAGSQNATAFYAHSNATDLLLDVDGYFAAPGVGGLSFYPVAPCRVLDTRNSGGQFMGEKTVNVAGSGCATPSSAKAYVFNATVVPPERLFYLTLWPDGQQQPVASTLNALDGFITSNMAIVPTSNGSIDAYAAGLTQLILDISGYFAPPPSD